MIDSSTELEALLKLSLVPRIGPNKCRTLVNFFKSAKKVFSSSIKTLITIPGIDVKTANYIKCFDGEQFAAEQLKLLEKEHCRIISYWDPDYPDRLKNIYDPPVVLFVKGTLTKEDEKSIAIIGTRTPTEYGKIVTEKLTLDLTAKEFTVVSGLAYGIDTVSHTVAVNQNGRTLAVLGSGLDRIYPSQNRRLADRITGQGAVITEFPFGTGPDRVNFPKRNRIICGLSLGIVVVEAGRKSGALITSEFALEQNREVFAVPGRIDSPYSVGTNALIKEGAKPVTCVEDILEEFQSDFRANISLAPRSLLPDLNGEESAVYDLLTHEPIHIDELCRKLKNSTANTLSVLLALELKNLAKQLPGKMFVVRPN